MLVEAEKRYVHVDYVNGLFDNHKAYWQAGARPYYVVAIDTRGVQDVTGK